VTDPKAMVEVKVGDLVIAGNKLPVKRIELGEG
jgi:hypothetical protein